jgi:hypothetical protein
VASQEKGPNICLHFQKQRSKPPLAKGRIRGICKGLGQIPPDPGKDMADTGKFSLKRKVAQVFNLCPHRLEACATRAFPHRQSHPDMHRVAGLKRVVTVSQANSPSYSDNQLIFCSF